MWMNFSHYSQLIAYAIAYFPHLLQMSETERQEKTRTLLAEIGELLAEGGPCNQENIMHLQLLVAGLNADIILFAVEQALLCLPRRSRGGHGPEYYGKLAVDAMLRCIEEYDPSSTDEFRDYAERSIQWELVKNR